MGNGNIDVGNKAATHKAGQPILENLAGTDGSAKLQIDKSNPLRKDRPSISVAMAQQCDDGGRINQSAPQKFVQLVGCREPRAKPAPWVRPRPAPIKP